MASAVVTATWLNDNGIPARVMDLMTLGGFEGLTGWKPGISARGIEVWVDDPTHIAEANTLLTQHGAELAQRTSEAQQHGPTEVVCDECGKSSVFPADQYGTIQDCPHCGEYVDVEEPCASTAEDDESEPSEETEAT
ncbi:MAG: DUF2007 domain-containing protein [Gemmataceae bacterium]|nr:DUF2007 domain-containing protein [Gemmataceae bacterium]